MSRKVFFSFHYERDAQRAAVVRNSDMLADEDEYGVIDAVDWEKVEREGEDAIRRWIQEQLKSTSVTVVLIGEETASRDWVLYEIRESWKRGNGIVGVRIHGIKNFDQETDSSGANPLDTIKLKNETMLSSFFKTYDWSDNNGYENLGTWVEEAFQIRESYEGEIELKNDEKNSLGISSVPTGPVVVNRAPRPWCDG
jgi:hypothetical protein